MIKFRIFDRRLLILVLMIFVSFPSLAEIDYRLKPSQVSENVYAIVGPLGQRSRDNAGLNANYGFVVTKDGVILIDSGPSAYAAALIEKAVKTITSKPIRWVLNTGSQDHRWLGNDYFAQKGAQIQAMSGTVLTQKAFANQQLNNLKSFIGDQLVGTVPRYASAPHTGTDVVIKIDGVLLRWLQTNAHYPGDTMIYLPEQSVVFTGDLVYVDRVLGVLPQSNVRQADKAFKQLVTLNPTFIVPGHGRVTNLLQAQKETGDYYTYLISNVGTAAQNMDSMTDTLDQFERPAQFLHLENFKELHRANMNRVYLDFEANP